MPEAHRWPPGPRSAAGVSVAPTGRSGSFAPRLAGRGRRTRVSRERVARVARGVLRRVDARFPAPWARLRSAQQRLDRSEQRRQRHMLQHAGVVLRPQTRAVVVPDRQAPDAGDVAIADRLLSAYRMASRASGSSAHSSCETSGATLPGASSASPRSSRGVTGRRSRCTCATSRAMTRGSRQRNARTSSSASYATRPTATSSRSWSRTSSSRSPTIEQDQA